MIDLPTLVVAIALLSVEPVTYIAAWRRPGWFQDVCRRLGSPVDVLARLFVCFKLVQLIVFVAWCFVHGGRLVPQERSIGILAVAAVLVVAGQTLNVSVFRALGRTGVFYGTRFGYSVPWRVTFPFSWLAHPQCLGALLTIWGFFVLTRYPAPDWPVLPVLETLSYMSVAYVEDDRASAVTNRLRPRPLWPSPLTGRLRGQRNWISANTKPSRSTTSPVATRSGSRNIGPSQTQE